MACWPRSLWTTPSVGSLARADGAELVAGQSVSADLFDLLDVTPLLGRFFAEEENLPGAHRVVVLPQTVWERDYNAQPGVLGQEIRFSGEAPYTIIGVAPRVVEVFDSKTEFFIPFVASEERFERQDRYLWPIDLWARLEEGGAKDAGLAQLKALELSWLEEVANPERRARNEGRIGQISLTRRAPLRSQLLLLQCGGLLLLVVGCINVLNLFLIRSGRRRPELQARRSLGASRWALVRLMLAESFLLAGAATACGAFLAWAGIAALNFYLPIVAPAAQPVMLSGPIWASLIAGGFGLAVVLGAIPIARLWRRYGIEPVRPASRGATAGASTASLNGWLLVG